MQEHTKIYFDHFGFGDQDMIPCERDGTRANDIHHVWGRGKGKNAIENLMALCRDCHILAHAEKLSKEELQEIHNNYLHRID